MPTTKCVCGALEGELHSYLYCDAERCPFCGFQLSTCDCANKHFYPDTFNDTMDADYNFIVKYAGLPKDVYTNGLPEAQEREWRRLLDEKGRVPFIRWPNVCARCGALWPELFMDKDWNKYVEIRERGKILCRDCFKTVKSLIDNGRKEKANAA